MKKLALVMVVLLIVGAGAIVWWRGGRTTPRREENFPPDRKKSEQKPKPAENKDHGTLVPDDVPFRPPPPPKPRSGDEKASLVGKIAKDYDEIMTKTAAEFSALGAAFPGGFNAYLRQLALLEREKWKDYAAVLTPTELEDLQMRDHHAGKLVTQGLADTAATDEQRRAVLRLQRDFDDKYSLIFDLTPAALLARETERQALQEKIAQVLGSDLFVPWLRIEGEDFARIAQYVQQQGLRHDATRDVWRIRNEFTLRRLEITARGGRQEDALNALAEQTRARIATVLGPAALQSPAASGLNWLPIK